MGASYYCYIYSNLGFECNGLYHCDNQAVVDVLRSRSCKDRDHMQLLRILFFLRQLTSFSSVVKPRLFIPELDSAV